MCDFDKNLVAWMDGELADNRAVAVVQHVSTCDECRTRLAAYENASRDFAAYYAAAVPAPVAVGVDHSTRRWAPYLVAAAAAIVIALLLLPRGHQPAQPATQFAKVAPPVAVETAATAKPVAAVPRPAKRRALSRHVSQVAGQPSSGPVVQIVIPADAMFPPGAMPDGVVYVANLNYTIGGAMPGYRLQQ